LQKMLESDFLLRGYTYTTSKAIANAAEKTIDCTRVFIEKLIIIYFSPKIWYFMVV